MIRYVPQSDRPVEWHPEETAEGDCLEDLLIELVSVSIAKLPARALGAWVCQACRLVAALPAGQKGRWIRTVATRLHFAFPDQRARGLHTVELDVAEMVVRAADEWQAEKRACYAPLPMAKEPT